MNNITMKLNADPLILSALREDINSEDLSANAVIPEHTPGEVDLIAKQDGIICGLPVFSRTFELLDPETCSTFSVSDGDPVTAGHMDLIL